MGNCQAIDAATIEIQHPSGKIDTLYSPIIAHEVMTTNPGHCVVLLISTTLCSSSTSSSSSSSSSSNNDSNNSVRLTRIKLLRPSDTLVLGQVYRLITTQEVMKGLWEKKYAKMKKNNTSDDSELKMNNQVTKHDGQKVKTATNSVTIRSRTWLPKLHSISEASS